MLSENRLPLQQDRDFGQIISVTFKFLKQNFKRLYKPLVFICMPAVLVAGFFLGSSIGNIFEAQYQTGAPGIPDLLSMMVGYFLFILAYMMMIMIVNEYLRAYLHGEEENMTVGVMWKTVMGQFWNYLGIVFLVAVISMVGVLFFIIPGIYLSIALSFAMIVHGIERSGVTDSMKRSMSLIKGHWWETFGLLMVIGMIQVFISYIFLIPMYILLAVGTFSGMDPEMGSAGAPENMGMLMSIFMMVVYGLTMLLYPISITAIALKYFSLVEVKESSGLKSRVDDFDTI